MRAYVYHPGEDAAHGVGVLVSRAFMSDGLHVYRALLFIEGEGHEGGPLDIGQRCAGCSKATGVDENFNAHKSKGGLTHVFASLVIFTGSEEEEESKLEQFCYDPLVCIATLEVPPTLV